MYANVCNGCFKTIYTMAVNLAREKGINTIVTGLSRGQFLETRLTEEVFEQDDFDVQAIDESIARARRAYHQRDDIISRSLDVERSISFIISGRVVAVELIAPVSG